MKKILSFLTALPEEKFSPEILKIMAIDTITLGLGFVIILGSFGDRQVSEDSVRIGSSLFALGVLLRIWRKENNK